MKCKPITRPLSFLLLIFFVSHVNAQVYNTKSREYKKAIKQRTKDYKKQGYIPMGSGTLNLYVTRGVNKEFETDEEGQNKFFVITTKDIGPTFESASTASRTSARTAIAANIETRVAELIKRSVVNDELSETSADGINKIIAAGKQLIAERISMEDIYTLYRSVKDTRTSENIVEVLYSACYSNQLAMQKAKEYIREELKEEAEELHEQLDNIFSLNP